MKTLKTILVAATMFAGVFGAGAAQAHPGHFYGRVGVVVDPWPLFYPGWGYYPYYAYPQVVMAQPAAPTVYVEQGQVQQAAPAPSNDWYYCRKPAGYYPYVRNCDKAWERVPAQPPAAPQQ